MQTGDCSKAPGSLSSPCSHKLPFVFSEEKVKKTDFGDWIIFSGPLNGLGYCLRVGVHALGVEPFNKGVP